MDVLAAKVCAGAWTMIMINEFPFAAHWTRTKWSQVGLVFPFSAKNGFAFDISGSLQQVILRSSWLPWDYLYPSSPACAGERKQAIGTTNTGEVWLIIVSKSCNSGYHTQSFECMMHWQCHPASEKLTFSPLSPLGPGSPYRKKK